MFLKNIGSSSEKVGKFKPIHTNSIGWRVRIPFFHTAYLGIVVVCIGMSIDT